MRETVTDNQDDAGGDPTKARAVCNVSGLALWVFVKADGSFEGIENRGSEIERGGKVAAGVVNERGDRYLPLYGNQPNHDSITDILVGPLYSVGADRVTRSYSVREKTARELLTEISWWYGATHSKRECV